MKHILNNLTEQEKNAIREQHTGGMKVSTDKFNQLMESKLGDVKPILSEQSKRVDVVKPRGQTIPLIQIKVAGKMCDLTMMRKLPTGASFYGKHRGTEVYFEVLFTCGSLKVIFAEVPFPKKTLEIKYYPISPQAYELLKKAAGCDAYVKNQDTSDDDVTLAEQDTEPQSMQQLRQDQRAVRQQTRQDQRAVRQQTRQDNRAVRRDTRAEQAAVADIMNLRNEFNTLMTNLQDLSRHQNTETYKNFLDLITNTSNSLKGFVDSTANASQPPTSENF